MIDMDVFYHSCRDQVETLVEYEAIKLEIVAVLAQDEEIILIGQYLDNFKGVLAEDELVLEVLRSRVPHCQQPDIVAILRMNHEVVSIDHLDALDSVWVDSLDRYFCPGALRHNHQLLAS